MADSYSDQHWEQLKETAKRRCDNQITVARKAYREALEAIDQVRRLERTAANNGRSRGTQRPRPRKLSPLDLRVLRATERLNATFGSEAARKILEADAQVDGSQLPHRASVAASLKRLVEFDRLEILIQPQGRRAGIYKRKEVAAKTV